MNRKHYIGWVRDNQGGVSARPRKEIANAVTSFTGGGFKGADGLGNTVPHVVLEWT